MKPWLWLIASFLLVGAGRANPLSLMVSIYQADGVTKAELPRYPVDRLDEQSLLCRLTTPLLRERLTQAGSTMGPRSLTAEVKATPSRMGPTDCTGSSDCPNSASPRACPIP